MKAVVLLSGGIDSTTCLADYVETYGADQVLALTLFYGQKHAKELECAKAVAEHYGVQHIVQDLAQVFAFSDSALLSSSNEEIPEGSYADESTKENGLSKTYVPFRNGLFLSYAAALAFSLGASYVVYGAHSDDSVGSAYPDCSPEFYSYMNKAVYEGTGKKVRLAAPLLSTPKYDVVHAGLQLKAPYHLTWSCYKGDDKACGKCATCVDRRRAFQLNNAVDPIPYEDGE